MEFGLKLAPEGKSFFILMTQEMMWWQCHQSDHMQINCTSLQTNHTSTSSLVFTGRMLFLMPIRQCQSTEGNYKCRVYGT